MARKRAKASAGNAANGGRRLVVVVAFDVVNFSALVEADEERVLGAWRALRQAIDPLITTGGGRIFKALGDGLLVEFTGPVDATRTALAVQAAVAEPALTAGHGGAARAALRHPHGRGHRRGRRPSGRRHQRRVSPAGACADRRRAGVGGGDGPDRRPPRGADRGAGAAQAAQHVPAGARLCRRAGPARGRGDGAGRGGIADRRQLPARAALDRRAALRRPDRGRRRLVVLRRAGRGHHRRAVVPARADRDQPRLGAALSRPGARAAARAARARRALHADRQRAPLRRQGAPVGRALRLRERHGDLDRPLRLRRRRSF